MLKLRALIILLMMGIAWPETQWAQQARQTPALMAGPAYTSQDGRDGPKFPGIDVVVRLVGSDGQPQTFQAVDMGLFSAGAEVGRGISVRTFAESGYGVKSILALDLSGSMNGAPLEAVRTSIARFVGQAREQDQVEVLSFANDTRIEVPFGARKDALAESLKHVESRGTQTHLYDGLLDALARLQGAGPVRRQLTVISDGHDEGSCHGMDEVIRQAIHEKVAIDSIGLTRSHPEYLGTLTRISSATGGRFARARSPQDLEGLINQGIQATREIPVVAFKVSNLEADGEPHELELRWLPANLSTSIEVRTPLIAHSRAIWGWAITGSFLTGLILLFVSRRLARGSTTISRAVFPSPMPTPQQDPDPMAKISPELPLKGEDELSKPAPTIRKYEPTIIEGDKPVQRARTRMIALFDSAQSPILEAIGGPLAGNDFPVKGDFRIGANNGNQLIIPDDPTLSGFHARILLADSVLTIEDSGSTNGTFVNRMRLGQNRKLLKQGDEIRVGQSTFRVRAS